MSRTESDVFKHPFFSEDSEMKSPEFKAKVKRMSRSNIYASLGQILLEYLGIACVIALNVIYPSPVLYLPSIMFIGSRMHGLLILMHDAAHYKFCNNKTLNDFICNAAIAFPLFINFYHWRSVHFAHHRDTGGEEDPDHVGTRDHPDYNLPVETWKFLWNLGQHMLGIRYLVILFSPAVGIKNKFTYIISSFMDRWRTGSMRIDGKKPDYSRLKLIFICYYLTVGAIIVYFGFLQWFLLFWMAPLFLWTHFITKLRSYSEHYGLEHTDCYENSRTMYVTWFDVLFLGFSWNVNLHLDHHLFPSVPSYRLGKLHNLIKDISPYSTYAHITPNGILGVIQECTLKKQKTQI